MGALGFMTQDKCGNYLIYLISRTYIYLRESKANSKFHQEAASRYLPFTTLKQVYSQVGSAICVQRFDDSQSSAIRITYRISLRSSSIQEPRYPS